jgi:hypothetical protein
MRYALIALLLTACATQQSRWHKYGATQADFDADDGYCTAQAFQNPGSAIQVAIVKNGCMRGRGWQIR